MTHTVIVLISWTSKASIHLHDATQTLNEEMLLCLSFVDLSTWALQDSTGLNFFTSVQVKNAYVDQKMSLW